MVQTAPSRAIGQRRAQVVAFAGEQAGIQAAVGRDPGAVAVAAERGADRADEADLAAAVGAIVRTPDMRQRLFQQGWQAVGSSPQGLANRIQADTQVLGGIIKAQRISAQ